jgi:hypothetical protein
MRLSQEIAAAMRLANGNRMFELHRKYRQLLDAQEVA